MSFFNGVSSITTALSGVQTIVSGNIASFISSSGSSVGYAMPTFYLGESHLNDRVGLPFCVWVPTKFKNMGEKASQGLIPRPLYLEEVTIETHIFSEYFENANIIKEQIKIALRDSQFWFGSNFGAGEYTNPKISGKDLWKIQFDMILMNPIADNPPLTVVVQSVQFVSSANGYIPPSGSIIIPSGSF